MKYYVGFIASWNGKQLVPMVYSEKKENVKQVLQDWSDRETKIEYMEDAKIISKHMKTIEFTGLKHV